MRFFLGAPEPAWLSRDELGGIPLFVSNARLRRLVRKLPRAKMDWALDSGGFSELSAHHEWRTTAGEYIAACERYLEIGRCQWMAPQDWMCEDVMLARTGRTVLDHQKLTLDNFLELRQRAPHLPFIPVLQGQLIEDYIRHDEMYAAAGVDLRQERIVGVGSVCRRQHTQEAVDIFSTLAGRGLALHGFGVKVLGFRQYEKHLASSDSMAWSDRARRAKIRLDGCTHQNCNYCWKYALLWREAVLAGRPVP